MAKKFFYLCAGILMLAGAYAIGANGVQAQVGDQQAAGLAIDNWSNPWTITVSGDIYIYSNGSGSYVGNMFEGTVASGSESLESVKSNFS